MKTITAPANKANGVKPVDVSKVQTALDAMSIPMAALRTKITAAQQVQATAKVALAAALKGLKAARSDNGRTARAADAVMAEKALLDATLVLEGLAKDLEVLVGKAKTLRAKLPTSVPMEPTPAGPDSSSVPATAPAKAIEPAKAPAVNGGKAVSKVKSTRPIKGEVVIPPHHVLAAAAFAEITGKSGLERFWLIGSVGQERYAAGLDTRKGKSGRRDLASFAAYLEQVHAANEGTTLVVDKSKDGKEGRVASADVLSKSIAAYEMFPGERFADTALALGKDGLTGWSLFHKSLADRAAARKAAKAPAAPKAPVEKGKTSDKDGDEPTGEKPSTFTPPSIEVVLEDIQNTVTAALHNATKASLANTRKALEVGLQAILNGLRAQVRK